MPSFYQILSYFCCFSSWEFLLGEFVSHQEVSVMWVKKARVAKSLGVRSLLSRRNQRVEHLPGRNSYSSIFISWVNNTRYWQNHHPPRSPSWVKFFFMSWRWEGGWPWQKTYQKILCKSTLHIADARNHTELSSFGLALLAWESPERVTCNHQQQGQGWPMHCLHEN